VEFHRGKVTISNCTFVNLRNNWGGIAFAWWSAIKPVEISNTIVAHSGSVFIGMPDQPSDSIIIQNCNFFDYDSLFYFSEFPVYYLNADPLFCDPDNDDFTISDNSPCAPAYSPTGELIGKYDVACSLPYICGDANRDQTVNVSDAVSVINYVFVPGSLVPSPFVSGDTNCDLTVNISDAVWIINNVFVGGNEPCDTDGDEVPDC